MTLFSSPTNPLLTALRRIVFIVAVAIAIAAGVSAATLAGAYALNASLPVAVITWLGSTLLLVFLLVAAAQLLQPRSVRPDRRRPRTRRSRAHIRMPAVVAAVTTVIVGALGATTVLAPVDGSSVASGPMAPHYWNLATGSHLAYWETKSLDRTDATVPIVYLHGGPGGYVVPADFKFIPKLAATGHDVYMFDQAGAGYSSNLAVSEYSLQRSLDDIDAVRRRIHAKRIIVVGHSAGGFLAAAYTANYPTRVERAVLISSGTYDDSAAARRARSDDDAAMSKIDPHHDQRNPLETKLSRMSSSRFAAAAVVMQVVGPDAAANLFSQDDSKRLTASALKLPSGLNLYENIMLTADFTTHWTDTLAKLRSVRIPTLLVRAEYDYIAWPGQRTLRNAIPEAKVAYIHGAEHTPWEKAPTLTDMAVSSFILNKPQATYSGEGNPALVDSVG